MHKKENNFAFIDSKNLNLAIDTKRLVRKIEFINKDMFEQIRKAARDML